MPGILGKLTDVNILEPQIPFHLCVGWDPVDPQCLSQYQ